MAINIIVSGKREAKTLYTLRLRFDGVVKIEEKYWELELSSVCITCSSIGYELIRKCRSRSPKCIICANPHKMIKHQYGINKCNKESRKIYVYVVVKCLNYNSSHPANLNQCASKKKVEIDAYK